MAKEKRTIHGVQVEVDPRLFSDWDFVMKMTGAMEGMDGGNPSAANSIRAMRMVDELLDEALGTKQKIQVFEAIRKDNDGYLPVNDVSMIIAELMAQDDATKKSSGSQGASPSTETSS